MLNRLQAASRLLIRASLAIFTGVVLLLIQSAFWSNRVSAWMQLVILATALLSYFRPHYGLLALAALVPLGQVGSRTLDSSMRGAEALVLAFLAGALLRGWTLREFRTFPSTRLHAVALIFGFVVAASCAEQIVFAQIQRDFAWPFAQELLTYASRNYIVTWRSFGMVFHAMLLLEGVALVLYTARYVREHPPFAERLVAMIVAGGAATAVLTLWYVGVDLAQTGALQGRFVEFFTTNRWTAHVGDLNAAGSFFAMGAFMALGMCFTTPGKTLGSLWLFAGAVMLIAMLLTGSRTAIAVAGIVGIVVFARTGLSYTSSAVRGLTAAAGVIVVVAAILLIFRQTTTTGATPSQAVTIRWLFLETTAHMLAAEPVFGIGIGQYSLWSRHFAPPELFAVFHPDNAHNNFAQIGGELGLAGLASFLLLVGASMRTRRRALAESQLRAPLLAGLAVFMLTWLGGHPLLIPEVAYPFWIALGIVAASAAVVRSVGAPPIVLIAAVLVMSLPFRMNAHSLRIDLSRVSYGVSPKQLMTSRARFFVPAGTARVEFPLRSGAADEDEPVEIDVLIDGAASDTITLSDRNWRRAPINLPGDSTRRFHQIDLQIRPGTLDNVDPDRRSVEVGKWEIIARPNG